MRASWRESDVEIIYNKKIPFILWSIKNVIPDTEKLKGSIMQAMKLYSHHRSNHDKLHFIIDIAGASGVTPSEFIWIQNYVAMESSRLRLYHAAICLRGCASHAFEMETLTNNVMPSWLSVKLFTNMAEAQDWLKKCSAVYAHADDDDNVNNNTLWKNEK